MYQRLSIYSSYPAPPFVTVDSIKSTMATMIVNPKLFPITSIRLFDHPGIVTRALGASQKQIARRFLLIEMDTTAGPQNFPVTHDAEPIHPPLKSTATEVRSQMAEHNLMILVPKDDPRLGLLRSQRPSGCGLSIIKHPLRRTHVCLLLTFDEAKQATQYLRANRTSSKPFFMMSAAHMYHHPETRTVITTKYLSPSDWALRGMGDVFPVHQTKYLVFSPNASIAEYLTSLNVTHKLSGRKPLFVEAHDRPGNVISLVPPAENVNQDWKEQASPPPGNDNVTIEACGFPIYAPQSTITNIVAQWTVGNQADPPTISPRTSTTCSAFFTVTNKVAAELKGTTLDTPLGSIQLRITEPDEELPTPLPVGETPDADFYDEVFPHKTPHLEVRTLPPIDPTIGLTMARKVTCYDSNRT